MCIKILSFVEILKDKQTPCSLQRNKKTKNAVRHSKNKSWSFNGKYVNKDLHIFVRCN